MRTSQRREEEESSAAEEEDSFTPSGRPEVRQQLEENQRSANSVLAHANSRMGLELFKRFSFLPLLP